LAPLYSVMKLLHHWKVKKSVTTAMLHALAEDVQTLVVCARASQSAERKSLERTTTTRPPGDASSGAAPAVSPPIITNAKAPPAVVSQGASARQPVVEAGGGTNGWADVDLFDALEDHTQQLEDGDPAAVPGGTGAQLPSGGLPANERTRIRQELLEELRQAGLISKDVVVSRDVVVPKEKAKISQVKQELRQLANTTAPTLAEHPDIEARIKAMGLHRSFGERAEHYVTWVQGWPENFKDVDDAITKIRAFMLGDALSQAEGKYTVLNTPNAKQCHTELSVYLTSRLRPMVIRIFNDYKLIIAPLGLKLATIHTSLRDGTLPEEFKDNVARYCVTYEDVEKEITECYRKRTICALGYPVVKKAQSLVATFDTQVMPIVKAVHLVNSGAGFRSAPQSGATGKKGENSTNPTIEDLEWQ